MVSVSPQASPGMTAAACSAAAQAMLDSPVLQETLTCMPRRSHRRERLHERAQPAELDGLEADAAGGLVLVMTADVRQAMDAFIRPDRDIGRGRHRRHAGEIVGLDRLLEEIEAAAGDRAHERDRLTGAETLIGIGRDQGMRPQDVADAARAFRVQWRAYPPRP